MSNKFEVLLYGFGRQCVLPEDQMLSVYETVHLTQRHVRQKILHKKNNPADTKNKDMINRLRVYDVLRGFGHSGSNRWGRVI